VALIGYGRSAALTVLEIVLPLGCVTALATTALAERRQRVGRLGRQFFLVAVLAVVQAGVAVALLVTLMFVSRHDAFFTVLVAGYAAALAIWATRVLGRRALGDLQAIRSTLAAVGEGRRDVAVVMAPRMLAPISGPFRAPATLGQPRPRVPRSRRPLYRV